MDNTLRAEANVLARIKHLLGEESVMYLIEQDAHFADFIDHLYTTVDKQSEALQSQT